MAEAAKSCLHQKKVGAEDPEGPTLCLGCAVVAALRYFQERYRQSNGELVINPQYNTEEERHEKKA